MTEQKSPYTFLWGDYQPHWTIETNINAFIKHRNTIWNQVDNIIQVSRNNKISCFHSKKDLENDVKRGKTHLDKESFKKLIENLEKDFKNQ